MSPLWYSVTWGKLRETQRFHPSYAHYFRIEFFFSVVLVFSSLLLSLSSPFSQSVCFGCHGWNHIISTPTHGPPYPLSRSPKTRCRKALLYIYTHFKQRDLYSTLLFGYEAPQGRSEDANHCTVSAAIRDLQKKGCRWQNCSFPLAQPEWDYVHAEDLAHASQF